VQASLACTFAGPIRFMTRFMIRFMTDELLDVIPRRFLGEPELSER
jgi:hypothetical protein